MNTALNHTQLYGRSKQWLFLFYHTRHSVLTDLPSCETSAMQSSGHFYILVIICIWPSGFRTAPRVALKTPKPWNAQSPPNSPSYQAKLVRIWLSVSLCQPFLSSSLQLQKKKGVCFYACVMMFMSTHMHTLISVSVRVETLLQTDGNLRHDAGGLSFEAPPSPPPIHPFSSCVLSLSLASTPPPSFSPCPSALTKQKESFNLTQAGPRTWLEAVEIFLCYYEESNLAVHLTQ